jgi:SDR family mycofactocin-dependent oxidoreductase
VTSGPGARRVALVTGAARGIGAAVVERLVAREHVVYAVDLGGDGTAETHELASDVYPLATREDLDGLTLRHGDAVVPVAADVRDLAAVSEVVDRIRREHGQLHVVVAGAAVIAGGDALWETDDALLDAVWRADAVSVWNTAKATMPMLLERTAEDRPAFVAIGSVAGLHGLYHLSAYVMAKHAVVGLVRALAADLSGSPVTVSCVCPGSTDTAMLAETARLYDLTHVGELVGEQAIGRPLTPDEIAAVVELACFAGPAVHGAVLPATGGFRL